MRKSNFFHFMIHLVDENQTPIEVEKAVFKDFHDSFTVRDNYCFDDNYESASMHCIVLLLYGAILAHNNEQYMY